MTSITVPEPVMSLAVAPKNRESSGAFSKALNRFTKEDPTFKVGMDAESGQTIISGMGELHLDIYVERMKREYKVTPAHYMASDTHLQACVHPALTCHASLIKQLWQPGVAVTLPHGCALPAS